MNGATTRIAKIALVAIALAFGGATATALARSGADGKPGGQRGAGATQTGTTTTQAPARARKIRVVGIVTARDEAARSFTLKAKNRKPAERRAHASAHGRKPRVTRTFTVEAGDLTVPAVGRQVLVKGTLDGTTIAATLVKVLRGEDNPHRHAHGDDDDDRGRGGDRGEATDGRSRGAEAPGRSRRDAAPGRAKGRADR